MIKICQLGCGYRPLTESNIHNFSGFEYMKEYEYEPTNVDIRKYSNVDIIQDLRKRRWENLKTEYYDIVFAEHIAEHMPDRIGFILECLRILKPVGLLIIEVPNWKHDSAHNTLEHCSTWGRCIFDESYISEGIWKLEKVEYRLTFPFTWKWNFYIRNEFVGRQIDKHSHKISGIRFYIRKL